MCRIGATGESPLYRGFGEMGAELRLQQLSPLVTCPSSFGVHNLFNGLASSAIQAFILSRTDKYASYFVM